LTPPAEAVVAHNGGDMTKQSLSSPPSGTDGNTPQYTPAACSTGHRASTTSRHPYTATTDPSASATPAPGTSPPDPKHPPPPTSSPPHPDGGAGGEPKPTYDTITPQWTGGRKLAHRTCREHVVHTHVGSGRRAVVPLGCAGQRRSAW